MGKITKGLIWLPQNHQRSLTRWDDGGKTSILGNVSQHLGSVSCQAAASGVMAVNFWLPCRGARGHHVRCCCRIASFARHPSRSSPPGPAGLLRGHPTAIDPGCEYAMKAGKGERHTVGIPRHSSPHGLSPTFQARLLGNTGAEPRKIIRQRPGISIADAAERHVDGPFSHRAGKRLHKDAGIFAERRWPQRITTAVHGAGRTRRVATEYCHYLHSVVAIALKTLDCVMNQPTAAGLGFGAQKRCAN